MKLGEKQKDLVIAFREILREEKYCSQGEIVTSQIKSCITDIDHNDYLIVIHTTPGAAQLIARIIDSLGNAEGILGTIAGDDTIFVTPSSDASIEDLTESIRELLS